MPVIKDKSGGKKKYHQNRPHYYKQFSRVAGFVNVAPAFEFFRTDVKTQNRSVNHAEKRSQIIVLVERKKIYNQKND